MKLLIHLECEDIDPDRCEQLMSDLCEAVGKANGTGEIVMICDKDENILWSTERGAFTTAFDFMNE